MVCQKLFHCFITPYDKNGVSEIGHSIHIRTADYSCFRKDLEVFKKDQGVSEKDLSVFQKEQSLFLKHFYRLIKRRKRQKLTR